MYVTVVHITVKPDNVNDFIAASERNHTESVKEPGNLRFDLLQSDQDPCKFILYEAYTCAEEAAKHKQTAHYQQWRDTVADWMAEPRQGVVYKGLKP